MIKITIEEKEFNLPDSWEEIKFSSYIKLLEFEKQVFTSNTMKMVKMVDILSKEEGLEELLLKLDIDDLRSLIEEFAWIMVEPKFKKSTKNVKIELEGSTYIVKNEYSKLTANEMIMIEELVQSKRLDVHYLEITFGVLLRKLDENGKELPLSMDLLIETINNLKDKVYLKDIFSCIAFFLNTDKNSSTKILQSSSPALKIQRASTQSKKK